MISPDPNNAETPAENAGSENRPDDPKIRIGRIVGYHGLKGGIKVRPAQENPTWVNHLKSITLVTPGKTVDLTIVNARQDSPIVIVLYFEGIDSRTLAEKLGKGDLLALKADLPAPDPDEYWADDIIGASVHDHQTREPRGVVKDLLTANGMDYLEIAVHQSPTTVLIPFTPHFFPDVDPVRKTVFVSRLDELFEKSPVEEPAKPEETATETTAEKPGETVAHRPT